VFPGACSQSDGVNTTILTYHLTAFAALIPNSGGALPTQQKVAATSTGLTCFAYSGPTTLAAVFGAYFSSGVTAINRFNLPAGNYSSWFRAAPSLATLTSLGNGDVICIYGPVGSNVFVAGSAAGVIPPVTPPSTPATVVTATTVTGVYCFAYSGPTTAVANFATRFNSAIVGVNRLNLPDGKFSSWFAAAPSLSTIMSLSNGDLLCVSAAVGSSVFR
jgi:hypothetical protein